ncbi:MAG TPA: LUD domain-containing protein [Pyrinomonadaceae bacterium]|nr:LUD domain-containing protein [Pyrinomonadaceae bacterium]
MNNSARESILGSIRTHLAASPPSEDHPVNPASPVILSKSDPVNRFKESVESVAGHCLVTTDVTDALKQILTDLNVQRVAYSDDPPNAHDIFHYEVGISTAQAAIAETGTLVLDSACERHRLVSLVPPVHIAIVNASAIVETLGDALTLLQKREISPAITFITGPSRTADIELTLAIGVHGPQELYVIVDGSK